MRILRKILSNKGQLSMEVGVLVAAAVLVAIIAGYYYITNVKNATKSAGNQSTEFVNTTENRSEYYINQIKNV